MKRAEIRSCVAELQCRMLLQDWDITVNFDDRPNRDAALAEIQRPRSYMRAEIRLHHTWPRWTADACQLIGDPMARPPEPLARLVAHELLHLHFHDLEITDDHLDGMLHRDVAEVWEQEKAHKIERVIDQLARVICG